MSANNTNKDILSLQISDMVLGINKSRISKLQEIPGNSLSNNYLCVCENTEELFIKIYYSENSTFPMQQFLYSNDIPVPRPIHELCIGQNTFCAVYEYITAQSVAIFLEQCSNKELASDIATSLRKMHNLKINAPTKVEDTHLEIKKLIEYINDNSINFVNKSKIINYLLSNAVSVPVERLGIIHMDFHLKNILISRADRRILFTDFENLTYGDTWRDFVYAALFHEPCENSFWHSFIESYFDNDIPKQFWESVKYYCYVQLLRMIVCEYQKGNVDEINKLVKSINTGFPINASNPQWYRFM